MRKPGILLLSAVTVVAVGTGAYVLLQQLDKQVAESRIELRQTFNAISSLTDEVALAKAQDVMKLRGYDTATWQAMGENEKELPYGRRGPFLRRNTRNANEGCIQFVDSSMKDRNPTRIVQLELRGDQLHCELIYPK